MKASLAKWRCREGGIALVKSGHIVVLVMVAGTTMCLQHRKLSDVSISNKSHMTLWPLVKYKLQTPFDGRSHDHHPPSDLFDASHSPPINSKKSRDIVNLPSHLHPQ